MNKVKLLSVICIGLLLTNLLLVGIFIFKKPGHPGPDNKKNIIIEKLNFNERQVQEYDKIIELHQKEIRASDQTMRELKNQLYTTLLSDSVGGIKDSLIYKISNVQATVEKINYTHFQNIKKICRTEQLPRFESLTKELSMFFAPPHPPHKEGR
jgi:hypothetical protein